VLRDDGSEIDATFRVERIGDKVSVVFEARGGTTGEAGARNTQYNDGLETLLRRFKSQSMQITDALVESRETLDLPVEDRRILIQTGAYPIMIDDPGALRRDLGTAQAKVGRAVGAKGGGNQTRRIRLVVRQLQGRVEPRELARDLSGGTTRGEPR